MLRALAPLVLVLLPYAAAAGDLADLDCADPVTQVEMTGCAARAYEAADAELNRAYKAAMNSARTWDEGMDYGDQPTNAALLRDAQRAWIPFRDAACTAESTMARGGTLANQLYYVCLERLTRARTDDLDLYAGGLAAPAE